MVLEAQTLACVCRSCQSYSIFYKVWKVQCFRKRARFTTRFKSWVKPHFSIDSSAGRWLKQKKSRRRRSRTEEQLKFQAKYNLLCLWMNRLPAFCCYDLHRQLNSAISRPTAVGTSHLTQALCMNAANKHARPHVVTVIMVLRTHISLIYKAVMGFLSSLLWENATYLISC